jgi:hypothetical protein
MAPPLPFRLCTLTLPFLMGCGSSPSASGTAELVISGEYQGRLDTGHTIHVDQSRRSGSLDLSDSQLHIRGV